MNRSEHALALLAERRKPLLGTVAQLLILFILLKAAGQVGLRLREGAAVLAAGEGLPGPGDLGGETERLLNHVAGVGAGPDDVFRQLTGGGAGWKDPLLRPVAAVEAKPAAAPVQKDAAEDDQGDDKSLFAVIKKIPDLLRTAQPAPAAESSQSADTQKGDS